MRTGHEVVVLTRSPAGGRGPVKYVHWDGRTLSAWARERLAPPKRPKDVYVVDGLPRTATGKVRRTDLGLLAGGPLHPPDNGE